MGNKVRCKFACVSVTKRSSWRGAPSEFIYDAEFNAVTDGSEENKAFWSATPSGTLKVATVASDVFEVGKYYYLDLMLAE